MTQDNDLTEEVRSFIGRVGPVRALEPITASDIRRYVDVTGDANPLWLDDAWARSHGYRGRLLPPMLVGWEPFSSPAHGGSTDSEDLVKQLPLPKNYTETRNAGTEIEWLRPGHLGESFSSQTSILDIVARRGKSGVGIYVTRQTEFRNQDGQAVVRVRQTTVKLPGSQASGESTQKG
jgi:acyl dehydratase